MTGSPSDTSEPPLSEKHGGGPRGVRVLPPSGHAWARSVPPFGKPCTTRGLRPGFPDSGGSLVSDGDPVIVFGPAQGRNGKFSWSNGSVAYYGSLASFASGQS